MVMVSWLLINKLITKNNVVQSLYEAAAAITREKKVSNLNIEFLKLVVSKCLDMANPLTREYFQNILTSSELLFLNELCLKKRNEFENINIRDNETMDVVFDQLEQFQHE